MSVGQDLEIPIWLAKKINFFDGRIFFFKSGRLKTLVLKNCVRSGLFSQSWSHVCGNRSVGKLFVAFPFTVSGEWWFKFEANLMGPSLSNMRLFIS